MNFVKIKIVLWSIALAFALLSPFALSASQCDESDKMNNRSLDKISFKHDSNGLPVMQVKLGVSLGKAKSQNLNMSFDTVVLVNGVTIDLVATDIVYESAITCAVTCSGGCPSIFGDGVCTSCNCDYGDWFAIPLPGIDDGDVIEVQLAAARGGEKETFTRDDRKRIIFKKP